MDQTLLVTAVTAATPLFSLTAPDASDGLASQTPPEPEHEAVQFELIAVQSDLFEPG